MKFDPKGYKYAKWLLIALIGMLLFFAYVLIKDSFNTRKDFIILTGQVSEKGNTKIKTIKGNNYSYTYYFRLSTHHQLFGIGTNEIGIPILDSTFKGLEIGETIQVTYDENWATKNEDINLLIHEIVRDGKVLYNNIPQTYWNGRMKVGLICLLLGIGFLVLLIIFNRKNQKLTENSKN
jgi:hypothetical protein